MPGNAADIAAEIHGATSKTTPVDADELGIWDSVSSALRKVTWANVKATLKTYTDTLYALIGAITGSGLTMSTGKLLGRSTASTGAIEEITVGTGLSLSGGTLTATGGGGGAVSSVNGQTGAVSLNGGFTGVKGADIASAATVDLSTATGDWVDITGSSGPITSFGTVAAGVERLLRFISTPTITHNATSLILPTGASITAQAGDWMRLRSLGSGNWVCVAYQRKDGTPLSSNGGLVLLESRTASSSSSLDFTTRNAPGKSGATFQSDFDEYLIEFVNLVPATNGASLYGRMSTNGGSSFDSGANYGGLRRVENRFGVVASGADSGENQVLLTYNGVENTATYGFSGSARLFNPLSTSLHKVISGEYTSLNSTFVQTGAFAGRYLSTTAVNALQFLFSSGNIASGTIRVYGVDKTGSGGYTSGGGSGGAIVQVKNYETGATASGVNTIPIDDTIPQNNEGDEYLSLSITPTSASNKLKIDVVLVLSSTAVTPWYMVGALFQDSAANALASAVQAQPASDGNVVIAFSHYMDAGTTSPTTFKVRAGANGSGTTRLNGRTGARLYGGALASSITITEITAGVAGVGGNTSSAAYASRPTVGISGNLFLPNDGFAIERDNGSIWQPWGPIFPMTPPVDGDFSWVNQGGASVSTSKGGIFLQGTLQGSDQLRCRVKTAPATPYTITACFLASMAAFNYVACGILFRQSSDGKLVTLGFGHNSDWNIDINKWNSATSISANYTSFATKFYPVRIWLRIADNGTNRICSWSADGQNFTQLHSVGRTDFMTADQVGFFCNGNGNSGTTLAPAMTLLSWKEA